MQSRHPNQGMPAFLSHSVLQSKLRVGWLRADVLLFSHSSTLARMPCPCPFLPVSPTLLPLSTPWSCVSQTWSIPVESNFLATDFLVNCKITSKNLVKYSKNTTFAAQLSYGVMVAQQVLVLFVVVRIRLGQQLYLQSPWKSNAFRGFTFWETKFGSLSMA